MGCSAMTLPTRPQPSNAALRFLREHPVLSGIFAVCVVGRAILGAVFLTEDGSMAHRLAAGAVAGVALLTTAPRIMG